MPRRNGDLRKVRARPKPVTSIAGFPPPTRAPEPELTAEAPKVSKALRAEFARLYRARCEAYEEQHGFSPMPAERTAIREALREERPDLAFTAGLH